MRSVQEPEKKEDELEFTPISRLTPNSRKVNVIFRVLELNDERHVKVRSSGLLHRVTEARVADETGSIKLTLWDDDIDDIDVGELYTLQRGHVGVYDESMRLNRGRSGFLEATSAHMTDVNSDLDMSKPFAWMKRKRRKRTRRGMSFRGVPGNELKGYCPRKDF